jgi:hypothetical protein
MAESRDGVKRGPKSGPGEKPKARARKAAGPAAAKAKAAPAAPRERKAAPRKAAAPKAEAPKPAATRRSPAPRAKAKAPRSTGATRAALPAVPAKGAPAGLSEEDQIRSAKYLPRDLPPRLFEEERFLFPETYGVNRVRLLVKDPEWLFAHWDVDPKSIDSMKSGMGERAMALSRLTLRVVDPGNGGSSDILLPPGARGWYIRADETRRSYKAELGITLPSGEFRRLAESNVVVTPRVGPSRERAQRRITFAQAGRLPKEAPVSQREAELRSAGSVSGAGPWKAPSLDAFEPAGGLPTAAGAAGAGTGKNAPPPGSAVRKGGASDAFRPGGASDLFRR